MACPYALYVIFERRLRKPITDHNPDQFSVRSHLSGTPSSLGGLGRLLTPLGPGLSPFLTLSSFIICNRSPYRAVTDVVDPGLSLK